MTSLVSVRNLSHHFGKLHVIDNVSLEIAAGSYTVLLGPSGSGKTTLLSILGGFLQPDEGEVLIRGTDCTAMAPALRPTATVFQDYALFPHMTIGNNVGFGLRMRGQAKATRDAAARRMLDIVELGSSFDKKPHQLSGGQRQRVALARALTVEPAVLLLDEPLGALDLKLRRQMQDELKAIQKRVGTAFVHVTHDQEEAMALADHVVVMNHGQIVDQGPPETVYAKPATRFAATFMGESTILASTISKLGFVDTPFGRVKHTDAKTIGDIHVAIRPEYVGLDGGIPAVVRHVVYQGSFKRVAATPAAFPDMEVLCRLPADAAVAIGDHVRLSLPPFRMVLLKA